MPLLNLGHGRAKRLEVVGHRLVHQNVAVGEKQNAFLSFGFPQAPDDLERGKGLAGAGRHHQQYAVLPPGNGFQCFVDRQKLIIAGSFVAAIAVIVLDNDVFLRRGDSFMLTPHSPQFFRIWKFRQ